MLEISSKRCSCAPCTPSTRGPVARSATTAFNQCRRLGRARKVAVSALNGEDNNQSSSTSVTRNSKYDKMVEQLKTTGMTQSKARELLRTWADLGAKDPEQVRKLLVNRSLQPVTGLAIQSALDVCAALFGFYTGTVAGQVDFPGQLLVQLAAYFFGCYYFIQAAAEAGALVAVVVTARKYSTDSDVMLAAIQELAGPMSGLSVIDKAQLAVNTLKIIQTLESIAESLKVGKHVPRHVLDAQSSTEYMAFCFTVHTCIIRTYKQNLSPQDMSTTVLLSHILLLRAHSVAVVTI